jgi:S1-C subfamily serine protease
VVAPKLGFFTQDLDLALARTMKLPKPRGVLVTDVAEGGPADKAGLHRGDVILSLNGKDTAVSADLRTRIYEADPALAMTLTLLRDGHPLTLSLTPENLKAAKDLKSWHGLRVTPNSPEEAAQRGLAISQGMVVGAVASGSSAEQIGIKVGDILLELNQAALTDQAAWDALTKQLDEGQEAVLRLVRGRQSAYVALPAEP